MFTKCLGRENLEQFFRVAPKSICGPLIYLLSEPLFRHKNGHNTTVNNSRQFLYVVLVSSINMWKQRAKASEVQL